MTNSDLRTGSTGWGQDGRRWEPIRLSVAVGGGGTKVRELRKKDTRVWGWVALFSLFGDCKLIKTSKKI